jgi:hypothetical protein
MLRDARPRHSFSHARDRAVVCIYGVHVAIICTGFVSIDLLVRTLVASGTSGATIGRAFADIDSRRKVRRSA